MSVSLQFDGTGDLVLDAEGRPVYDRPPTGDLYLATAQRLGSFHADPDLGSLVPALTAGEPRQSVEIKDAIRDGLARLEAVGVLVVDDILVFDGEAAVYTSATDQAWKVTL